jgi:hypothetical protein
MRARDLFCKWTTDLFMKRVQEMPDINVSERMPRDCMMFMVITLCHNRCGVEVKKIHKSV